MNIKYFATLLTAALLIGCGSDSHKQENNTTLDDDYCTTEFISNDGQPSNNQGFYGDNVCFGTKNIVGKWKRLLPNRIEDVWEVVEFKSDGNIQYYDINGSLLFASSNLYEPEYGVDSNGTYMGYY